MTDTIIKTIPMVMAANLVSYNLKKKKKRSILGLGMDNITGVSLIQATAQAGAY
jgi:hypothetical protein